MLQPSVPRCSSQRVIAHGVFSLVGGWPVDPPLARAEAVRFFAGSLELLKPASGRQWQWVEPAPRWLERARTTGVGLAKCATWRPERAVMPLRLHVCLAAVALVVSFAAATASVNVLVSASGHLPKIVNHCAIHSVLSSGFCHIPCVVRVCTWQHDCYCQSGCRSDRLSFEVATG